MDNPPFRYKILIIGDSSVGKTSIIKKYINERVPLQELETIGIDFMSKSTTIDNQQIKFLIWDTAGQEKFRALTRAYYRGAQGVFIVFDLTDIKSKNSVPAWIKDIENNTTENIPIILVGNKLDKFNGSLVEMEEYAKELELPFIAVSAKAVINIENLFNKMGSILLKKEKSFKKKGFNLTRRRNNCC
ncbi:ras-related Rab-1A [Tubulinosema ratisbonensis]|uniref:Ras-related Rab-1A n=1 Tax=Tubulinosema ratisbonensis TaxID=291195 RepID=A0A437AN95_9MICR|nr:ras-related Rab-1A [Tubulinosema ratisbonensis]